MYAREKIKKNIIKLVKDSKFRRPYELEKEAEGEFAKLLGLELNFFKRVIFRKGESGPYTEEEIAEILISNSLVDDFEEASEVIKSLEYKSIGPVGLKKFVNRDGEVRYIIKFRGYQPTDI